MNLSDTRELHPRLVLARALLGASIGLRNLARRLEGRTPGAGSAARAPAGVAIPAAVAAACPTRNAVFLAFLLRDLYFSRACIVMAFITAAAALALDKLAGAHFAAFIAMYCAGSAPAAFLCLLLVFGERQERSHLFALSLPISPARYLLAKVLAVSIAFLGTWLLLGAATALLLASMPLGAGLLPYSTATWLFVLDLFCMLLAITAASQSVGVVVAANVAYNIAPAFFFYYIGTISITAQPAAVAVWSPQARWLITAEMAAVVMLFALTFWSVLRPRDQA
jgi:ABC-2 type transport system permease protein